ncbi:thioredoxin-like domain-containing protein [Limnoglobus roseus]|uniref:TlpA family protein disulfide reductase n=1 Tax=Limnoglobus roseus TaxID=2598579 RepID=A0A5C1ABW1_9BACT|nr:thioredoxin-like domain-containing protein [Limnoglobus roseus]QEL16065.1 TlpA family protein disulfide reductase [Limnoglobus roseus]
MRACWTLLVVGVLTTQTGCRLFERWQKDRPSAEPTSRTKDKDRDRNLAPDRKGDSPYELPTDRPKREPGSFLDPPTVPSSNVRVPAAGTWAGPTSKNFDLRNAAQRLISGTVETQDGQLVEGAFVALENADPTKNTPGAQIGVQTDRSGLFLIQGLKPGDTYILTASVRNQIGKQYVTVPNQQVKIQLRDDFAVTPLTTTPGGGGNDLPGAATASPSIPPPGGSVTAPPLFDTPRGGGNGETLPYPSNNDGSFSPVPPAPPVRPELVAPGPPTNNRLPPVAIPGPSVAPPLLPSPGSTSRSIDRDFEIKLLDEDGKVRSFPSGREGDLLLLDFASTNCIHCTKAIPTLTKLHDAYRDQALQVVTVLCDTGTTRQRLEAAEKYRKNHRFPYELQIEATAGTVQDAFSVKAYPTLVLIDGTGRRLWSGHPKQVDQLERAIREFVDARAAK